MKLLNEQIYFKLIIVQLRLYNYHYSEIAIIVKFGNILN